MYLLVVMERECVVGMGNNLQNVERKHGKTTTSDFSVILVSTQEHVIVLYRYLDKTK